MHLDRMKRHARGTKPLRGLQSQHAARRLAHVARIRQFKDDAFTVKGVILGHEPWPIGVERPDYASPKGGAR